MSTILNQLHINRNRNNNSAGPEFISSETRINNNRKKFFAFDDLLNKSNSQFNNPPIIENKRSNTAPASPHSNYYISNNGYTLNIQLNSIKERVILPSLRHLQLLPDPRIQEYAYKYPDTSEATPTWKKNLIGWCKEKSYQDYIKIVNETSYDRYSNSPKNIPSVLKPLDAFQNLSNVSWNYNPSPITPPMSPSNQRIETNKNLTPEENSNNSGMFNPVISPKLVQMVKKQTITGNISQGHKKTNSFKAIQLKKMLNNRDILNYNTTELSKPTKYVISNTSNKIIKPTSNIPSTTFQRSRSLSPSSKKRLNSSPTRQFVMKLDNYSRNGSNTPRSNSLIRSAPVTPPQESTSKYHKFNLESPPKTPTSAVHTTGTTISGGHKYKSKLVTPRRRSNGSPHHLHIRKCVSCQSSDSPCWRPSWSGKKHDQLCNSCGLRFKKTHTRCLNDTCKKIPTKSELTIMKSNGIITESMSDGAIVEGYRCLFCNNITETTSAHMTPKSASITNSIVTDGVNNSPTVSSSSASSTATSSPAKESASLVTPA